MKCSVPASFERYGELSLAVCAFSFLCGILFCCFGSQPWVDAKAGHIHRFMQLLFEFAGAGQVYSPSVAAGTALHLIWLLPAALLGPSLLGLFFLPAVLFLRGFSLASTAVLAISAWGRGGLVIAFTVFGLTALLTVPVLFSVSVRNIRFSCQRLLSSPAAMQNSCNLRNRCFPFLLCFGAAMFCSVIERRLVLLFISSFSTVLFT